MAYTWVKVVVLALAVCGTEIDARQQPLPPPPELPTLSPRLPPPWLFPPPPDPLPSPPDAPMPDLGRLPGAPDKSKSPLKRTINRLAPTCLDAATHTCWSSRPGKASPAMTEADRAFANDMEVGDLYFKHRNYKGAELRYRDALIRKPGEPDATFKLAETLGREHKNSEARTMYEAFLRMQPTGLNAERAQRALEVLANKSSE